ncbi:MAG: hypothetical protein ABW277_21000 [Longimicrobiaceae bacterium]
MFTRCIFCHAQFPENRSLEHLRRGRRIAFDPARGRLWTVCGACGRWTLAPIEERWEALEELDRLATDRARLLSSTDNVALLRTEELELVRVGRAERAEEAWWRYGRELTGRRQRATVLKGLDLVAVAGIVATTGVPWLGTGTLTNFVRWQRFGRMAIRGRSECPVCGGVSTGVKFSDAGSIVLVPGGEGEAPSLFHPCVRCGRRDGSGHLMAGTAAEHALRRILAQRHFSGASEGRIRAATLAIDQAGSSGALAQKVAGERLSLYTLERSRRTDAVALEIALADETERRMLEMELWELERRWKEEEELAAIVDRELSFVPGLDRLRAKLGGRSPA